jgi:hypothetical protein
MFVSSSGVHVGVVLGGVVLGSHGAPVAVRAQVVEQKVDIAVWLQ